MFRLRVTPCRGWGGAEMTLFEHHKEKFRKNVIWYKTPRTGRPPLPNYPINMIDGRGYSTGARSLPPNPLIDNPATNILAETSDKFIAILNIVKQQNARIEEFERMFPLMRKRIIELERIVEDEVTNDQLTGVSDSDVGLIVNTQ